MPDRPSAFRPATDIECHLRRSERAKRLRLVVRPDFIELIVPAPMSDSAALAFLARHRDWAEAKMREFRGKLQSRPAPTNFCDFTSMPWQGREVPLRVAEGAGRRVQVSIGDAVRIDLPEGLGATKEAIARRALYLWVRPRLAKSVAELAETLAPGLGVQPRQIRIKAMKTRWGSCGPLNDININWLLALVPREVMRYVVIHELCHIRQRNHSTAFWALVAQACPDYRSHRKWLRLHGQGLIQRFAPAT